MLWSPQEAGDLRHGLDPGGRMRAGAAAVAARRAGGLRLAVGEPRGPRQLPQQPLPAPARGSAGLRGVPGGRRLAPFGDGSGSVHLVFGV